MKMGVRKKICAYKNFIILWRNVSYKMSMKEIFEKLSNEYKFEVEDNVARYLGYAVILNFPDGELSVWQGSDLGFQKAVDYSDAVDKVEKCLAYIARAELEYKKEMGKERLRKMEADFV